jgi:hypothetical protein
VARALLIRGNSYADFCLKECSYSTDLEYDTRSVCLSAIIPKDAGELFVAEFLWRVSRAFAETEGVAVDWMHEFLEGVVQGFEDDSEFKFVWERRLAGNCPKYPQLLSANLRKLLPSRDARPPIPQ